VVGDVVGCEHGSIIIREFPLYNKGSYIRLDLTSVTMNRGVSSCILSRRLIGFCDITLSLNFLARETRVLDAFSSLNLHETYID